jgi:hypothetical protein
MSAEDEELDFEFDPHVNNQAANRGPRPEDSVAKEASAPCSVPWSL